jgi:curved DNA-binding protein CbpA
MKDYHYILGVPKHANQEEIKSAYRKLSKKFHPDLNDNDKFFEERFKDINEAYEYLLGNQNTTGQEFYKESEKSPQSPAIVRFEVIPKKVSIGDKVVVYWDTKNCTTVSITKLGKVELKGSRSFVIQRTSGCINFKIVGISMVGLIEKMTTIEVVEKESPSHNKQKAPSKTERSNKRLVISLLIPFVACAAFIVYNFSSTTQDEFYGERYKSEVSVNQVELNSNQGEYFFSDADHTSNSTVDNKEFSGGDVVRNEGEPFRHGEELYFKDEEADNIEITAGLKFFYIGSTMDELLSIQGQPTQVAKYSVLNKETWNYGRSTVDFLNGKVEGYHNYGNNLKIKSEFEGNNDTPEVFSIGATKVEVTSIQGTPTAIADYNILNQEVWTYGRSTINFSRGRMDGYANYGGNLKVSLIKETEIQYSDRYTIGSTKSDVLLIQGTPTQIVNYKVLNQETWSYGISTIGFENGRLREYANYGNNLRITNK